LLEQWWDARVEWHDVVAARQVEECAGRPEQAYEVGARVAGESRDVNLQNSPLGLNCCDRADVRRENSVLPKLSDAGSETHGAGLQRVAGTDSGPVATHDDATVERGNEVRHNVTSFRRRRLPATPVRGSRA
jgi:hypothetical protein